jgi:pimeloyl-ACP methyl ester carboxylesterase
MKKGLAASAAAMAILLGGSVVPITGAAQKASPPVPDLVAASAATRSTHAVPGCPDRGGLLNSVSVPVGQPLELRVQIGNPAPEGGARFRLSSDDPSIVAAGDARQAFLPEVFIPQGQTVSNTFTVYGIRVGRTQLRLIALTAGFGSGTFPLGAWDLNRGGDERFVDANPAANTCRANAGSAEMSTDPARLAQCGRPARGVATDGVSQLLLRAVSGLPGTMCFEITTPGNTPVGTVQTPLTESQQVGNLAYGFSFYRAPDAFESAADFRDLEFEVTFTPNIGNGNTTRFRASTRLVRPPVALVHGVWSSAGAWDRGYSQNNAYRSTHVGDYSATNGARFETNSPRVRDFVEQALQLHRNKGFAATQADVMGHSMGGLLTRLHAAGPDFRRPENFDQGDVRRLLTLNTPHSGSTFGNLVVALHRVRPSETVAAVRAITDNTPRGGAVCDLAENSPALSGLNGATALRGQVITGTGGPAGTPQNPAPFFGGFLGIRSIEGQLTRRRCVERNMFFVCTQEEFVFPQGIVDAFRFRQANDTIVSLISQRGGHCSTAGLAGINFGQVIHSGPGIVNGVLSTSAVAQRAYQELDRPANAFAESFPGVGSTSLGAACTVPGRGAVLDAQDHAQQCGAGGPLNRTAGDLLAAPAQPVHADPRVQITAPVAGQVFAPGDVVSVTVSLSQGLVANDITVVVPGFDILPGDHYDGQTYRVQWQIPQDFAGELELRPEITDSDNMPVAGAPVRVAVRAVDAPQSLAFQQSEYRLTPRAIGPVERLAVFGTWPGPLVRQLSSGAAGTTWLSSDNGVVSVDADGWRQVHGTGVAVVTASNAGLVDHAVFVVEDPAAPLPPSDVTAALRIDRGSLRLDRNSGFFVQTVKITNAGSVPVPGPLQLVISGLPAGVNLISQSGITQQIRVGSAYVALPLGGTGLSLPPGHSVELLARFLNPSRVPITYVPTLWRFSGTP